MNQAISYTVSLNITLEIIINDPDLDDSDIVDTVKDATESYLTTSSAKYVYNLTVTLIDKQNDVLSVNIFIQSEEDLNDLDEEEVFEECDKEIDTKYGDRADVKNPYSSNDENYRKTSEYLLYAVAGLALIVICCGVMIIGLCVKMKHKSTHSDKARSELCLSVTDVSLADVQTTAPKHSEERSGEGNKNEDADDEIEDDEEDLDDMYEVVSSTRCIQSVTSETNGALAMT